MQHKLLYLTFLIILLPYRLLAWGHEGHQLVAELAMYQLSDATRQKVERVLGGMKPEEAGSWMDKVRSSAAYRHTEQWHYTNIEKGESYKPAPKGDIITVLNKAYAELQHPEKLTPEQVKLDVLILFHLCGDLLQPLHVAYGSDKGGNNYQVNYNGKGTNLHTIWDSRIIASQNITLASLQDTGMKPTATSIKKLRTGTVDFMAWLNQSRALLNQVYDVKGHKLDDAYMQKNKAVVETQLKNAGTLLASCLEHVFSKATNIPVAPVVVQKPEKTGKALSAGATITPDQAAAHIGETVAVCGKVYGTRLLDNGPTFINMGGEYPNNPFTAVIMFNKRGNFSYKLEEYLDGKTICVTGTIKDYKGKPQIVVDKEEQIRVQ